MVACIPSTSSFLSFFLAIYKLPAMLLWSDLIRGVRPNGYFPNSNFCSKLPSTNLAIIIPWTFYWKHFNFHYSKLLIKQSRILKTFNWKTSCFMTWVFLVKTKLCQSIALSGLDDQTGAGTFVWYLKLIFLFINIMLETWKRERLRIWSF